MTLPDVIQPNWRDASDPVDMQILRQCVKNILYTVVNSNAMNISVAYYRPAWWKITIYVVDFVAVAVIVFIIVDSYINRVADNIIDALHQRGIRQYDSVPPQSMGRYKSIHFRVSPPFYHTQQDKQCSGKAKHPPGHQGYAQAPKKETRHKRHKHRAERGCRLLKGCYRLTGASANQQRKLMDYAGIDGRAPKASQ